MNSFSIGLSALTAGQRALDLIGQNISNAATPGYHRQAINLVDRTSGSIGNGVDVASITRYNTPPVRTAILQGNSDHAATTARLNIRQQIESTLGSGTGGISDSIGSFFNQIGQLTSTPDDTATRQQIVGTAKQLSSQFNSAATAIDQLRDSVGAQVKQSVSTINTLASKIAGLNQQIATATQAGGQPNELMDQRDQLIDQLSQQVDVKTVQQPFGVVNVLSSNAPIVVGESANSFKVASDPTGNLQITQTSSTQPASFTSGTLGGLLQEYNQDIPTTRSQLDTLAGQLIQNVNEIQATGLGTTGPATSASGTISVADPTQPLASQNLPFPISAGTLTVSVTDASGNRTNTAVSIDPATMSLNDVATALSGVSGLSASVDPTTNTLKITAQSGYSFDFAGRDTNPAGGGAVANPDTGNVLSGLGVGSFFTGTRAGDIAVNPAIAADPRLLAASKSGDPGDGANLQRFATLSDQPMIAGNTLSNQFTSIATAVGTDVQTLTDHQTSTAGVLQNLNAQEQSITGVDENEELTNMLSYQQMIEGASKFMETVNTTLDSIMNIVR